MKNNSKKVVSLILCACMFLAGCNKIDINEDGNRFKIEWAVEDKIEEKLVADGADKENLRIDFDWTKLRFSQGEGRNSDCIYVSGEVTIYENWDSEADFEELMKVTGVVHDFNSVVKYDSEKDKFIAESCTLSYYESYKENAEYVLSFEDIFFNAYSGIIKGKVNNSGKNTYSFLKIKVDLKDKNGNIIDSDWTYAVGSEGLSPGASNSFSMYFTEDGNIKDYEITIMDYDVD